MTTSRSETRDGKRKAKEMACGVRVRSFHFFCLALIGGLVFLMTPASGHPPNGRSWWANRLGYASSEVFPITVGAFGFPYLSVGINGRSIDLVLDTGNMRRLGLTRPSLSKLRLPPIAQSRGYDERGALVGEDQVFRVVALTAFGRSWHDQKAFEIGEPEAGGLFGPYYLLDGRFTLDYGNGRLAVSRSLLPKDVPGDTLNLVPNEQFPGMPVVQGAVNGHKVLIQIDTGKSRTCVDPSLVRRLNLPTAHYGYALADVRIGSWNFKVPSARKVDFSGISRAYPSPILVSVGSDVLPQVIMTVDYRGGKLNIIPAH